MRLHLKVVPKASNSRIVGWVGERLKIAVTAPPERGKANEAVIDMLAAALGVPASRIRVVTGLASPLKTVEIPGEDADVLARLPARGSG